MDGPKGGGNVSKSKIIPGKGFQYTPQTTIEWADDFNELLESHSSRNVLVSKLIEDGLKVQNGFYQEKGTYLPLGAFSDEQLALLKTEEGKKILYNIISLILGNPDGAVVAKQMVQPIPEVQKGGSQTVDPYGLDDNTEKKTDKDQNRSDTNEALSKLLKLGKMTNLKGI